MIYKYIIIDGDSQSSNSLKDQIATMDDFYFSGQVNNAEEGLNLILESNPDVVFLGNNLNGSISESSFTLVNELYKYMVILPKIIVISNSKEVAYEAMKYDVYDFLLKPFKRIDIIKTLLKFKKEKSFSTLFHQNFNPLKEIKKTENYTLPVIAETTVIKENTEQIKPNIDFHFDTQEIKNELIEVVKQSLEYSSNGHNPSSNGVEQQVIQTKNNILCIKSYGDYRFIEFEDIVYLKADNNSTDIILVSGDSITAFKTLKYFESSLPSGFVRIHNSHIINIKYVSRIHLGNSDCYLYKGKIKLPFSKSYKDNINAIIDLHSSNDAKED
jgi:DNA-binding LytR/AlgR family response regulator